MSVTQAKLDWFESVILPHQRALRSRVRRMVNNPADIDDIVSEAMARAYANEEWRRITSGRSYLFTIARNLVIDMARRSKVVSIEIAADIDAMQSSVSGEALLDARDELRWLEQVVAQFPPQCRRAFILRRVHEKSFAEIAEEMKLSVSTVEKHVAKAVTLLSQAEMRRDGTQIAQGPDNGKAAFNR